jgi:F-type H+-transporting ATPase subunit gamma
MASLKEMRNRISSIKSIQKITKALQMVAAAKLRGATDAATKAQPYARRMANVIANLSTAVSGPGAPLLLAGTGRDQRHLIVVATGDRGLAGGFNSGIAKAARERIKTLVAEGKDVKIIAVGRKGRDALRRHYGDRFVETYDLSAHKKFNLDVVQPIADKIIGMYEAGEVDVVTLFSSRFVSVVSQVPTGRQLIPAVIDPHADFGPAPDLKGGVYTYEPDEETILEALLPRNIAVQLLLAVLENQAGFYAAQMTAMDNATRNAGDLIARYTLEYNRSRQAQITKELIEIISGAEALK